MNDVRKVVLHQSLIRPILLGGAERGLAMVNGIICAALVLGVGSWQTAVLGIIGAIAGHAALVQFAKVDPQLFDIYRRYYHYRKYYPAQSRHMAQSPMVKYFKP